MLDVVQLVKEGKGHFEWSEVVSNHKGYSLHIKVFRDALKFDNIPEIDWYRRPKPNGSGKTFNGVRLPASAYELQQIADLLGCMMLTPKVIDLIWLQAKVKFDAIVSVNGRIVANSDITKLHLLIEKRTSGKEGLVSCVGKYWCLINDLALGYYKSNHQPLLYGDQTCCNYGWFAKVASGPGLTPGTQCWQRPGFKHDNQHLDPSQTIRLMHPKAILISPEGEESKVDLHEIAKDPELCHLISHEGPLQYLRQAEVPRLDPLQPPAPPEEKEPEKAPEPETEPEAEAEPELEPESEPESERDIEDGVDSPDGGAEVEFKPGFLASLMEFFRRLFKN